MSGNWDKDDIGYEDYDPNKDYSVQVQRNDGGLSATQRALASIEESKQIGATTAVELHRQGEALKRTKEKLDESETVLRESEGHLKGIKSFWGQMTQKWFGPKPKEQNTKSKASYKSEPTGNDSSSSIPSSSSNDRFAPGGDALKQKISQNSKPMTRDQQINKNLDDM